MNTLEYLKIFDTVLTHTFDMYRRKQTGPAIPIFMETELFERARIDTLYLHRQ